MYVIFEFNIFGDLNMNIFTDFALHHFAVLFCSVLFFIQETRHHAIHTVYCCAQASGVEDHWSVREAAARLAALVCAKYGEPYYQIQPRITQALNSAFQQTNNPLNTHYGAPCLPSICLL